MSQNYTKAKEAEEQNLFDKKQKLVDKVMSKLTELQKDYII